MSDTDNLKTFDGLMMKSKQSTKGEWLAKMRERQRRERKEKLYSCSMNSRNTTS